MSSKTIITGFILFLFFFFFSTVIKADNRWWNDGWRYRKILTFNNAGRSENLQNFPVLIKLTSANFDFSKTQSGGQDIRFIDSDNNTQLPYEIELWDSSAKTAVIWVKVPQIDSNSASDFIYVYYGNNSASDSQTASSVWDSNFEDVWHLKESGNGTNGEYKDSTSNANHGQGGAGTSTKVPILTSSGKIDGALAFDGTDDYIKIGDIPSLAFTSPTATFTIASWVKFNNFANASSALISKYNSTGNKRAWAVDIRNDGKPSIQLSENGTFSSSTAVFYKSNQALTVDSWYNLVFSIDIATDTFKIYINGELVSGTHQNSKTTIDDLPVSTADVLISAHTAGATSTMVNGTLDEIEVSNIARSSNWINARYANDTDTLVTYSDEKNGTTSIGLSLNNELKGSTDGKYRMYGTVDSSDLQFLPSAVQYQINGSGWYNATATDNAFDELTDEYYFDFSPKANDYKGDGFTARLRTVRGSEVQADNVFYFSPFNPVKPENNATISNTQPAFTFAINKNRFNDLKDNLARFSIELNRNNTGWKPYIDSIPVSYENGNAKYEDKKIWVSYANNNSTIDVYAKAVDDAGNSTDKTFENGGKKLSDGKYLWRVVAIDKRGHRQETDVRTFQIGSVQIVKHYPFFPLTILSLTGVSGVPISTTQSKSIKSSYSSWSVNPNFYGIAVANSTVTLTLSDLECMKQNKPNCVFTYNGLTNHASRWGINIPKNVLKYGKSYTVKLSVKLDEDYNELPPFILKIQK